MPRPCNKENTAAASVELRLYDVQGRLVRTLVDEVRAAGANEARWDGRNEGGRRAASGVYFCRLRAGAYEATGRLVLVR